MLKHWKIIIIICFISSVARFVLDSYLPSLPAIGQYFDISDTYTQLTLTLYLLGFGLAQLIYGPLSDSFGRKRIILLGLAILITGSVVCALASSPSILCLGRLIAGVGAGACGVLNRAIASDCFKGPEFAKAWSHTTTALVLILCLAPIIGGYIQEVSGWRANFLLATGVVGLVFIIILKFLPETHPQNTKLKTFRPPFNWNDIQKNYIFILTRRTFITATVCYTLAFSGLIIYFQVSPLLLINKLGFSPAEYGWSSVAIAANYFLGGMMVNKFVVKLGTPNMLFIGALLLITGGLLMTIACMLHFLNITVFLLASGIYVLGARIVIPNAIATSLEELSHLSGSSSALIGCIQMIGSSLISCAIASFNHVSPLLLGLFWTGLSSFTLIIYLFGISKDAIGFIHGLKVFQLLKIYEHEKSPRINTSREQQIT